MTHTVGGASKKRTPHPLVLSIIGVVAVTVIALTVWFFVSVEPGMECPPGGSPSTHSACFR